MADLSKFDENPQQQLLEEVKGARCVMLGSPNASEHMQPMAPQIDKESLGILEGGGEPVIYFYSDNTSDLGRAVLAEPGAVVDAVHIDADYQASMRGRIYPVEGNDTLIERFWNPIVGSWFPGGQEDPKLLMLQFIPEEAAIWASSGNPLKFIYETVKANVTDTRPDVGKSKVVNTQAA